MIPPIGAARRSPQGAGALGGPAAPIVELSLMLLEVRNLSVAFGSRRAPGAGGIGCRPRD